VTTEEAARSVCLAASRADVQADGWMDLWMPRKKLTPFNDFIHFCVYDVDCRQPYQKQYRLSEHYRQLTGYSVQQLIKWVSNCGRETQFTYVTLSFFETGTG
jgi:hypothetical protein